MGEECVGIPLPFDSDLRQQKTAAPPQFDDQSVSADLDVDCARDGFERAEQRQLDLDGRQFRFEDRGKPRVSTARSHRAARDDATERIVAVEMSDAAAQIAVRVEGDERRAAPAEHAVKVRRRSARARHVRGDGLARETEEKDAISI